MASGARRVRSAHDGRSRYTLLVTLAPVAIGATRLEISGMDSPGSGTHKWPSGSDANQPAA